MLEELIFVPVAHQNVGIGANRGLEVYVCGQVVVRLAEFEIQWGNFLLDSATVLLKVCSFDDFDCNLFTYCS